MSRPLMVMLLAASLAACGKKPAADPFEVTSPASASKLVKINVSPEKEGKTGEVRRFPKISWGVASLAFSPTGGVLAAGHVDRKLQLYDVVEEAKLDKEKDGHKIKDWR